jgi:uncharacterized cupin superfamily protein
MSVVHEDEVPWKEPGRGKFGARARWLGWTAGNRALGCTLYELPPGKLSFPYHWHTANEEGLYVLEGEATLRLAGEEMPLRAGHYVAFPTGEKGAHQVINHTQGTFRYLCFSTMQDPEVVLYPDSGKIGVSHRGPGQTERTGFKLRKILAADAELDYFHGEE